MKKLIITTLALSITAPSAFLHAQGTSPQQSEQRTRMNQSATDDNRWSQQKDQGRDQQGRMNNQQKDHSQMSSKSKSSKHMDKVKAVSQDNLDQKETLDRFLGSDVVDRSDQSIGTISDLTLQDGEISDVLLSVGGVFGIGGDTVQIPFEALEETRMDNETAFRLDVSANEFTEQVDEETGTIQIGQDHTARMVSDEDMQNRMTAKSAAGAQLVDQNGEQIGTVRKLGVQDKKVTGAYIELNRDMGQQNDLVHVPFDSLESVQTDGEQHYRLGMPVTELTSNLRQTSEEMARTGQREMDRGMNAMTGASSQMGGGQGIEHVQRQVDLILSSYEIGSERDAPDVEVREDGNSIVLSGTVTSSELEDHIVENVRELSQMDVRNQLEVNDNIAVR